MILAKLLWAMNGIIPIKKQTFTYFIPAPPQRKSGYREKNFDSLINELVTMGFRILDTKTQTFSSEKVQGMWVVLTVAPFTKAATNIEPNEFPKEFESKSDIDIVQTVQGEKTIDLPKDDNSDMDSKGIYYFD